MKKILLLIICLLEGIALYSQTTEKEMIGNPVLSRGHFSTYPAPVEKLTPAPEGYVPVYISHYGRHGSRYHTSRSNHTNAYKTLKEAKEADLLTSFGKSVYKRVKAMRTDAKGRDGGLTDVGTQEHKDIAERMFKAFPEVFAADAMIDCRATEVPRCILSMAANNERLKELNPALRMYRSAYEGYESFLRKEKYLKENKKDMGVAKKTLLEDLDPSRFIGSIFNEGIADVLDAKAQNRFMRQIFALYQIAGCTAQSGVNLDDVFAPEELFFLWKASNAGNYAQYGNSKKHGKGVTADARPLLKDIVERADDALAGKGAAADLRFGHDTGLAPLASLINVNGYGVRADALDDVYKVWTDFNVMPMAANIQFIFYRNADDGILVKILYNEREATFPGLKSVSGPYYSWKDLRQYLVGLLK